MLRGILERKEAWKQGLENVTLAGYNESVKEKIAENNEKQEA